MYYRVALVACLATLPIGLIAGAQSPVASQSQAAARAPDTTITIHASSSTLEFMPANLAVRQGTRVTLRFVNAGTLPHNFVLVKNDDDVDALALAAMQEGGDYVPAHMKDLLVAYTALASPAQTVAVTFTAPPPGVYTYVCLVSGHAGMMLGTFRSLR